MEKSSCDKLKVGIVGVGNIGKRHAHHVNNIAELVAVCDIDILKVADIQMKYNCKGYTDIDKFLDENDFDLVSICTPNGLHCEHTVKSLQNGNNVLCEKPMALSSSDCEKMMSCAERHNKRLFIVKQNRFNPPIEAVKEAIDCGELGKIISVHVSCFWNRNEQYYEQSEWRGTQELDGGTLYTQFSHFIDILYWMIGDIEKVQGFKNNFIHDYIDFEDSGVVSLKFKNGALGTIHYTINSHPKNIEGSITIFGTKGTVKIGGEYLNKLEYQSFDNYVIDNLEKSSEANDYGSYKGSMSNHDKVYENIIDVLQNGSSIVTNMIQAYKVVNIIETIYRVSR